MPLPKGYTLDQPAAAPKLPAGYTLDSVPDAGAQMRSSALGQAREMMEFQDQNPDTGPARGFHFSDVIDAVNPMRIARDYVQHMNHPYETASGMPGGGSIAEVLPVTPAIQATEQVLNRDYGGAAGTALATGAQFAVPIVGGKLLGAGARAGARVLNSAREGVLPRSGSPVQQEAANWAMNRDIPLDAAAATQNPLIRGAQELAQTTPGAASQAQRAIQARHEGYARTGRELAAEAYPAGEMTPEAAGRAIADKGLETIRGQNATAGEEYGAFRARESDPANVREVVTGTEPKSVKVQTGSRREVVPGVVDASGNLAYRDVPVHETVSRDMPKTESIPFPVDMREFQAQFKPMLEQVQRQTRLGQQQYAPAQIALEDLVNGPEYKPASAAEADLGALKEVVRKNTLTGGVKNEAGQMAASLVDRLQDVIDGTVKRIGGPEALDELRAGRLATRGKYEAINLVDQLKTEPVRLYDQLTSKRDASIDLLRQVNKLAPEETPALGRAWLEAAMDKATDSGRFDHADKLYSDWNGLGNETKKIMFRNPTLISDLDNFFQSAKDSARIEGPSGTARVAHISGTAGLVIAHPVAGTAYVVGMNALSRLLYNPSFVRAAIRGFKVPAGAPGAAAAAGAMVSAAKAAGVPVTTAKAPEAIAPEASPVQASEGVTNNGQVSTNGGGAPGGGESLPRTAGSGEAQTLGLGNAETSVKVAGRPGSGYKARYTVKELEDLQASHSGITFQENQNYGPGVQQRDYTNAANQGKIVSWSSPAEFDPSFHINDNPDATNGPPVIDSDGNVLGGNGRVNIMQRVYGMNQRGAAAYRGLLERKAPQFGIDPASLKGMKKPVLVRELADSELGGPSAATAKQNAIADFNVKPTAELTPAERAISDSRRVSQDTLEHVASRLESHGADATIAQVVEGKGGLAVLDRLISDGVISPQERAAFADSEGLTPAGRDRVAALMVGRFFEDPKQLDTVPKSIRNKVERLAAPLAQVEASREWSLTPAVKDALSMIDQADKLHIRNMDDFIRQEGLFGAQNHSPEAIALAKAIHGMKPLELQAAARQYAQDASHAGRGADMFGNDPTPETAFEAAFGVHLPKK
jgi:hypothetical protein